MKKSLPTSNALLAAIRAKCMDCSGNARSLVERCNIKCARDAKRRGFEAMLASREVEEKWFGVCPNRGSG